MEPVFGHDFSSVRIHTDSAAAASADSFLAEAYTFGNHVVFGSGQLALETLRGRRLLAHELAHVVQQQRAVVASPAAQEHEARATERIGHPVARAAGMFRPSGPPGIPFLQFHDNIAAVKARLREVQARLAQLRARHRQLSESFTSSLTSERERASLAATTGRLHAQSRSEQASRGLWGGSVTARRIQQAVTVSMSGSTATLIINLQLAYLALSDGAARRQATVDIPRIEAAIRDVWQVNITGGDYAGVQFRGLPRVTYVPSTTAAAVNAFLIQVRGPDSDPSAGDAGQGIISLAPAHLQGSRVVVVAHELAHLFGFMDAYFTMTHSGPGGSTITQANVARADPRNRPDLLGMIDPVLLQRWQQSGAVTPQDVARQTGPVHVWEEDATIVLGTLAAVPPPLPRPTPESEDSDPEVELGRVRREGESRLSAIRSSRARIENSLEAVTVAEHIIQLEAEERTLQARLGANPGGARP